MHVLFEVVKKITGEAEMWEVLALHLELIVKWLTN